MLWNAQCPKKILSNISSEMTPLYLYLLAGSLAVPLLFSIFIFDFIKYWKNFIISTSIISSIFLLWDVIFTHYGVWEFNLTYCLNFTFLGMPIEEWLFFFIIPFCSLFIHFGLTSSFPKFKLGKKTTKLIAIMGIVMCCLILVFYYTKAYTAINFILLLFVLTLGLIFHIKLLQHFFLSFLIILIPFFFVNGILTGAVTELPIVSYNNEENLGLRLVTIPLEDIGYAFSMLFGNLMIFEFLNKKRQ
jgi:lycopene cyclase domain-containing protein